MTNKAKHLSPVLNDPYPMLVLTIHGKKSKLIINILKHHVMSAQMLASPSEVITAMKSVI